MNKILQSIWGFGSACVLWYGGIYGQIIPFIIGFVGVLSFFKYED